MSTITLTHEREIDAPAARTWAVLADYRRDPEWRTGLVAPGTTTVEELRLAGRTYRNDGLVLEVLPGERFEWRTTDGAVAEGSRTVVPLGPDRSRAVLELRITPTGLNRLMAPMLRRMLDRNLVADLDRLAEMVVARDPIIG